MTYIFDSTPEQTMAAFMDSLPGARGDTPGAQAEFRATMAQLAGLHQALALHAPVDPGRMARFREESAQAMLPFGPSISFLVNEALILAEDANDYEWPDLCLDRSVIQFLIDDYAGTPIPALIDRADLAELDQRMHDVGDRQGPLAPHEILRGMPASHWWWHYPQDRTEAPAADADAARQDGADAAGVQAARITLVLDPQQAAFAVLPEALAAHGWQLVNASRQPIIPGEPEHALFERGAQHLAYSFNPVCRLRLIEVPPDLDHATLAQLPVQTNSDVKPWLLSSDERTQLRGILAAAYLPHAELLAGVEKLQAHPRASIAQAAQRTAQTIRSALQADAAARASAHAALEVLKAQLTPLLRGLAADADGSLTATLRPRAEDYARAFAPQYAPVLRAAYEELWAEPPRVSSAPSGSQLQLSIAPAGMLLEENELSRQFPGGYRTIAPLLDPHRVWVAWKLIPPGKSAGTAYDGLVWLDDHWAWFPKPYRVLAALIDHTDE